MNGNDLNNMTQKYKEEMMRLYQQSGTRQNGSQAAGGAGTDGMNRGNTAAAGTPQTVTRNGTVHSSRQTSADTASARDMTGTSVQGTSGASFYGGAQARHGGHHGQHMQGGVNVPVNCDCRFPSAESIINQIAATPTPLPLTPEDYAGLSDTGAAEIQPRNGAGLAANENSSGGVAARSIMINSADGVGTYAVPSQSESEQEISPDFALPADIPADSSQPVPSTRSYSPSVAWISLTGDNSWGFLQFDVFTGEQGYPVQGALVTVKKKLPGGTGLARILFTNRSGLTSTIALPAPSSSLSLDPNNTTRPFSEYIVTVSSAGYYSLTDINLPVFAGVKTVQPIDLIPLPSYGGTPIQPRSDTSGTSSVG
ncbi:MAG: hypothetical protein NC120_10770 [Ruminococcus sp.]|nr:hypothetical protein [Ruminococcus sp.]